ncbi:MAG: sulfotransferase domain-containing protein [Acidobacteria bacterium]|nr:sulfotransferase domain-containing protein [Acidobacteriota bacterium]
MGAPEAQGGPPPWINPGLQQQIEWRDGDIVISVPPKSGTTWTMNIVHQLLTGGDADFADIYAQVPWIEFVPRPGVSLEELAGEINAMDRSRRRAFKTHSAPPGVPFIEPGTGPDVRYLVVCRDPEEALVSLKPFLEQHAPEWFDLWGVPHDALVKPDFPTFYQDIAVGMGFEGALFGFLQAWWALRDWSNVRLLHFSDMKKDHDGSLQRIADFIGVHPSEREWAAIREYTSFAWMKQHDRKFEASTVAPFPVLRPGAMVRKGKAGAAAEDGMTPDIARHLRDAGSRICPDETAVRWFYEGGPVPASR